MRRKTWIIAVAVVGLAGALGAGLYWQWVNSPRYALQQAALALKTHNMDKFFTYVDLNEIVKNFVEASSHDQNAAADPHVDELTRYTRGMAHKFGKLFLPKIMTAFQPQIRRLIEHYLLNLDNTQILGVAAAVTVAHIDTQGDAAQVTLTDPKSQEKFRFQMHRQPNQGAWQIVAVNYDDLKRVSKREFHF
jgi:hypothetical protein